jgi:acyl-CoA synthetase (AMP-forming)/AMP-acid ligase II
VRQQHSGAATQNKGDSSMESHVRYRPVAFGDDAVQVREANGASYMTAAAPLGDYAVRSVDRLRHWAQQAPERTFIARRDAGGAWRHISYAQALHSVRAIGEALLARELGVGRPVVILSGNDLEHALLGLACQYVGIPYAPISPAYSLVSKDYAKLRHIVELLNPGLVFAADGIEFGRAVAATCGPDVEFVVTGGMPAEREATSFAALERTEPTAAVDAAMAATGPDTIAKFLFTSGSTKLPKAVVNTQRMLCSNMQMLQQVWPFLLEEPPVLLDWLPWNHTFGGNKDFNMVLFNGGTLYIDDGKPTPQGIATTIANLREIAPTVYFNVPKGWDDLADALAADTALRDNFYSRLKLQFYAGAALAQPVWDKLHASAEAASGERIRMTTGLGMTETAPCALFAMREDVHAGELGVPAPGMEVKLVPCGDKIEVRYRGPSVTPGLLEVARRNCRHVRRGRLLLLGRCGQVARSGAAAPRPGVRRSRGRGLQTVHRHLGQRRTAARPRDARRRALCPGCGGDRSRPRRHRPAGHPQPGPMPHPVRPRRRRHAAAGAGVRPGARLVPGPGQPPVPPGHRQRQPRGARVAADRAAVDRPRRNHRQGLDQPARGAEPPLRPGRAAARGP